jgi:hypothetical protein
MAEPEDDFLLKPNGALPPARILAYDAGRPPNLSSPAPRDTFGLIRVGFFLLIVVGIIAGTSKAWVVIPILFAVYVVAVARILIWPKVGLTLNAGAMRDFDPPGIIGADLDEATQEAALHAFDFDAPTQASPATIARVAKDEPEPASGRTQYEKSPDEAGHEKPPEEPSHRYEWRG